MIEALRAAAPDLTFEEINLEAGRRGAVVEHDFYADPTALGLDARIWNLLWTGEETVKKGVPILKKKTGFEKEDDRFRKRRRSTKDSSTL